MRALLRAEWLKVATTRLWWVMGVVVLGCALLYSGVYGGLGWLMADAAGRPPFSTVSDLSTVYNGGNTISRILALVVGVLSMGGEYRHRTLSLTYLAEPRRVRVLLAKAVVSLAPGLLYGLLNALAGVVVAVVLVTWFDGGLMLGEPATWRALGLGVLSIALWGLLGMGIGVLIRSTLGAVLVAVGFAYLLEPLLSFVFLFQDWTLALNLMPSGATNALLGIVDNPALMASPDPFPWWGGLLVLLGWAVLPAAAGIALTVRRDV